MGSKQRVSERKLFKAFTDWIHYTLTVEYLSIQLKVSRQTLSGRFSRYLTSPPDPKRYFVKLTQKKGVCLTGYLLIDGDWFGNERVCLVYKDSSGHILFWRFSTGEYKDEVVEDIQFLVDNDYPLKGVVCDGKRALVKAGEYFHVPVQRCLVHLQLKLQTLLTKNPRTEAGKDLLFWSRHLNQIESRSEARVLVRWYLRLFEKHKDFINEKTIPTKDQEKKTWWYTHKYLRQAYYSILNAKGYIFPYLRTPGLPKDTNGLEGFFSQVDGKVSRHRGLDQLRKENLIAWLFYLREFKQKP